MKKKMMRSQNLIPIGTYQPKYIAAEPRVENKHFWVVSTYIGYT